MARLPGTRRPRLVQRGAARVDPSDARAVFREHRVWSALGIVEVPDDFDKHFEIESGDNGHVDVMVYVMLVPDREHLRARLGAPGMAVSGGGVWAIPRPGTEVALLIPGGDVEGEIYIVGAFTGSAPAGLTVDTMVIACPPGGHVLIHDGATGDEKALATKDDIDALANWDSTHTHTGVTTGMGVSGTPSLPAVPTAAGTQILKAK